MSIQRLQGKLHTDHNRMMETIERLVMELAPFLDFLEENNLSIFHQASDGFILEWEGNNAPLHICIEHILRDGSLSKETYLQECI